MNRFSSLNNKAPVLLFAKENLSLLDKPSLGFCGSRKASEKGLKTAWDCADQMAQKDVNIVSGYAAGVDMASHKAALEAGGSTTIVLAEGILNFRIKKAIKELFDESQFTTARGGGLMLFVLKGTPRFTYLFEHV